MASARRVAVSWLGPLVTFAGLILLWAAAVRVFDWPIWLVPSPEDVWRALVDNRSLLPHQTWVTLVESVAGFALAVAIGIPVAIGIASSPGCSSGRCIRSCSG